ncbi:retrovirus-related pol polyprotein from transposon TNT 1-94, partial [Tanacetum coccineum]
MLGLKRLHGFLEVTAAQVHNGNYAKWIKQYFQIQDYALWEVIKNGDSWVSVPHTSQENGITIIKMSTPATYPDAKSMFAAIETRFGGNAATKKTQKTLLKQQYKNFSATSAESLDSIFNRLQKIVSRLAILGVIIAQEDLNLKFLSSLPPEWNTHVVVWMNKPEVETMSIDDLYNNFKIVEQKVKKTVGTSSGGQNLAFMTAPSSSSTNDANTACPQVSAASPSVNAASPQVCTASVSDNTVYAFMVENPNGSNVLHQDLEQIHEDDLEAMDLKWQLSLLSVRAKKYYQRTGKKIFINANDIAGYDKSKVECYNCHKLGYLCQGGAEHKESRKVSSEIKTTPGSKETMKTQLQRQLLGLLNGVGFDWRVHWPQEHVQTNMALMTFLDSEVYTDKTCSKTCLKNYEILKKQYDDLLAKLHQTEFKATTYKRGLDIVEAQLVTYRKNEVLFGEEVVVLKREVGCKQYEINMLKTEFEKVKQEKDGIDFKIEKFDKATKDLDQLLGSQITDKSYGPNTSKSVSEVEPTKVRKNNGAPIIEDWVSDDEEQDEFKPKFEKKSVIPTTAKKEFMQNWKIHVKHLKMTSYIVRGKMGNVWQATHDINVLLTRDAQSNTTGNIAFNTPKNGSQRIGSGALLHYNYCTRMRRNDHNNEVENQLGKKIKAIRSDRGGEYLSHKFVNHLKSCGIVSQLTPPYTPQYNEVFERRNRTLLDMVQSIMDLTTLPKSFWGYALEAVVCIFNMVPTKKVERKPYEIWHRKAPKLSYLRVWDCEALVKRDTLDKLD